MKYAVSGDTFNPALAPGRGCPMLPGPIISRQALARAAAWTSKARVNGLAMQLVVALQVAALLA
jgi:hypothetical protein